MCLFLVVIFVLLSMDIIAESSNSTKLVPALKSMSNVKKELLPDRYHCGHQRSDYLRHTTDGTSISEFPWLGGLIYRENKKKSISCGGSLINNRYVLTAAHCLPTRPDIKLIAVRLGEYNLKNKTDCVEERLMFYTCSQRQDFRVRSYVVHQSYSRKDRVNDIGLIRLRRTVVYSDYVRPICLPTSGAESAKVGDSLVTTGWGTTAYGGKQTEIKKKILATLISNEECAAVDSYYKDILTISHGCTRETASATEHFCQGDSGGPVMFSHEYQWQLEGIVSFSTVCNIGDPTVYTKVSKYLGWIRRKIRP